MGYVGGYTGKTENKMETTGLLCQSPAEGQGFIVRQGLGLSLSHSLGKQHGVKALRLSQSSGFAEKEGKCRPKALCSTAPQRRTIPT